MSVTIRDNFELSEEYVSKSSYFDTYRSSISRGVIEVDTFNVPFSVDELQLINKDIESLTTDELLDVNDINEFFGYTNHSITIRIIRCWYMGQYTNSRCDKDLLTYIIKTNDIAAAIVVGLGYQDVFSISNDPIEHQIFYTRIEDNIANLIPLTEVINCVDIVDRYPRIANIGFVNLHINNPDIEAVKDRRIRALVDVVRINNGDRQPLLRIFHKNYDNRSIHIILRHIKVTEYTSKELVTSIILSLGLDALRYNIIARNTDPGVTDILIEIIMDIRLGHNIISGIIQYGHTDLILRLHRLKRISLADYKILNYQTYVDVHSQYNIGNDKNPSNDIIEYILYHRHWHMINRDLLYKFFMETENTRPIFALIRDNQVEVIKLIPVELIYNLDPFLCVRLIKMGATISNIRSDYKRIMTKEMINFFLNNGYVIEEYPAWLFNLIKLRRITTDAISIIRQHLTPNSIAMQQLDRVLSTDHIDYMGINYSNLTGILPELIRSLTPESLRLDANNEDEINNDGDSYSNSASDNDEVNEVDDNDDNSSDSEDWLIR